MMSFLAPKGLRADVTEGIDLEQGVMLSGPRITVGSGSGDTLRLGAADVVPGHLTFERRTDGKGWDYFTSDRGVTAIDRGNPRTGTVRPGMWFRLGRETRIDLTRAALPATPAGEVSDDVPATVPMPVALGLLGAMAALGLFVMTGFGGDTSRNISMRTTPYVTGAAALSDGLQACFETSLTPTRAITAGEPGSAFWRLMAHRGSDPAKASAAAAEITRQVREILASAHLLARENKALEASGELRRIEYVLPVGDASCPILAATRFDLALLELRGSR